MRIFNFFKRKQNPLDETTNKLFNELFPGGKKDIEKGTKVLIMLLSNKLDYKTASTIFMRSATFAKVTPNFTGDKLKEHLASYGLHYFDDGELTSFYEFLTAFAKTTSPINLVNSSDFSDKLYNSLLETGIYIYPDSTKSFNDAIFAAFPDGTMFANEEQEESQVMVAVYLWLRYVAKKNKALHSYIMCLISDYDEHLCFHIEMTSIDEKIDFINQVIKNKSIEQLCSDPNVIHQIFIRATVYYYLLEELTEELSILYSEGEEAVNDYVTKATKDYLPTPKITQITNLTPFDVKRIAIRDLLSGKELK